MKHREYGKRARGVYRFVIVVCSLALIVAVVALYFFKDSSDEPGIVPGIGPVRDTITAVDADAVEDGIHLQTGLIAGEGYREVIVNCTSCHSASLVIQNRMDAKGWEATIKWMQETQNLWDLGDKQEVIIRYLVENYPVESKGRRQPLSDIQWYALEESE